LKQTKTFLRPCHLTSGKAVPATSDWLHEIKFDGFRLMVRREGRRASSPIVVVSLNALAAKLCLH
jgi:ATP-dependent DNA ligase